MNYKQTNNKIATYGEKSQSVADLQNKLNSMGANIKVDSMYGPETQKAYNKYMGSSSNVSNIESPTPATDVKPSSNINTPEPEAPDIYDGYRTSIEANLASIKEQLAQSQAKQKEANQAEIEKLRSEQDKMLKETDPTKRATYEQEQRVLQNQLRASETASATLEQDFNKRRQLTSELEGLLNQGNAILAKEKGLPLNQRVINARTSRTMSDISARAGVIESVFSALDGNISQAHNLINQAKDTVSADWNDRLNYYNTILKLNNDKILTLDEENRKIADNEVKMMESNISRLEKTSDYIKGLMIDPDNAQFMADAGVTLTDSIEEINAKIAKQSRVKEIADVKNEMVLDGYTYVPFPTSTAGLVPITVGDQTMYFKPKPENKQDMVDIFDNFLKTGTAPSGNSFGNAIGEDGYVDPYVYIEAIKQWPGTITEFLSKFPVKQYVNPESYKLLPASVRPTTKSSSSATGMSDEEFLQLLNQ